MLRRRARTRITWAAAALAALATVVLASASGAQLPLAPLASAGRLAKAPAPGKLGPEQVPIPKGKTLAYPQELKLGETIDGVTCQRSEKIAFHVHAHLTIFVDGKARQIPYGIGIGPPLEGVRTPVGAFVESGSCFMWLHTHAADGVIHVEAPKLQTFRLGQFFAVWGQKLSRTRVGPARGKVTVFYDGKVWTGNPNDIPLTGQNQIQLDVGSPVVAPEHIAFPEGLAGVMSKPGSA
jgi:hypothetical protein